MSRRYLEIILNENISLRNIAAITFTEKAASELFKKIASLIDEKIKETDDEQIRRKLERYRRQLISANISTIHSFCIDILREYPVEANIDANFTPIDEQLSNELIELSVEELIKQSFNSPEEEPIKYLIRIFSSKNAFAKELIKLIKYRKKVIGISNSFYSKSENEISDFFRITFHDYVDKILHLNLEQLITSVESINDAVLQNKAENEIAANTKKILNQIKKEKKNENLLLQLKEIKDLILTKNLTVASRGYLNDKNSREELSEQISFTEKYFNDFKKILEIEDNPNIEIELAKFGKTMIRFFEKGLENYNSKKSDSGYLDFEDILLLTQEILKKESVRENLSQKFKYIMVDEYQDTNEIQYEIFLPILDYLKSGNLFVVGDEKQSIYMFRDADLEVFTKTRNEIELASGKERLLSLPDSFRMAPALCLFTNYLFKNLFASPNNIFNEVEHADLICARNDDIKGKIEILIPEEDETGKNKISDADFISRRILKLVNEDKTEEEVNWRDIAILCRKRKSFSELETSFVQHKIPFVIVGGKGFYQRQTIYDIYNYFSFLLDQENSTALVGILRSPFFSISDSEIFEISIIEEKSFWQKFVEYSKQKDRHSDVVKILSENINLANSQDVNSLLRKIINETPYLSVIASRSNSAQELANVDKLIKITTSFTQQDFKTLYDYVYYLKDSIEQTEDESQASVTDESNSVKIMTLHQAKGLEFPAVFLFHCEESTQRDSVKSKAITVDKDFGLLTKVPLNNNYFSDYQAAPIVSIHDFISEKKNLAEIKRLFYVGVTRAKNHLFLCASYAKDFKYKKDSFMGLLEEGANIDFSNKDFRIMGNLDYLINENDNYVNKTETLEIQIPIVKNIEEIAVAEEEKKVNISNLKVLTNIIEDRPEGEIISATKISVYKQCPLKYQLTYELGFTSLLDGYKKWEFKEQKDRTYEFNNKEDVETNNSQNNVETKTVKLFSEVKGSIIHEILQNELKEKEIESFLVNKIEAELNFYEKSSELKESLKNEIIDELNGYYKSSTFEFVNSLKNSKNEFEIYVKENDYYLYGIIDKLVIEDEKIFIFDYKTDDILDEEIPQRAEGYFNQLKFYSYIVSRLYEKINNFRLQLIFLKFPEHKVVLELNKGEVQKFSLEIEQMVKDIRDKNFSKNLTHCKKCSFSLNNGQCILK